MCVWLSPQEGQGYTTDITGGAVLYNLKRINRLVSTGLFVQPLLTLQSCAPKFVHSHDVCVSPQNINDVQEKITF